MLMWSMSDRHPALLRTMEGFGVHLPPRERCGRSTFVKFHWKPGWACVGRLGRGGEIAGADPGPPPRPLEGDPGRWRHPEWDLGPGVRRGEADSFDFDVLDPTKLIPEEVLPVRSSADGAGPVVENVFAETEQVAFCPATVVPGIDFQQRPAAGRLLQLPRHPAGGSARTNFTQLPVNAAAARCELPARRARCRCRLQSGARTTSRTAFTGDQRGPGRMPR